MKIVPIMTVSRRGLVEVYNRYRTPKVKSFETKAIASKRVETIYQENLPGFPAGMMPRDEVPGDWKGEESDVKEWESGATTADKPKRSRAAKQKKTPQEPVKAVAVPEISAAPVEPATVEPEPVAGDPEPIVEEQRATVSISKSLGVSAAWIIYNSERNKNATR